jgi:hypothetical protein
VNDTRTLRKFGAVFAAVSLLLAWTARHTPALAYALVAAAVAILALAWLSPALLERPARAWLRLGSVMHKVVNPVVLGVLYVVLIIPTGLLRRLFAGDAMQRRRDPALKTYWIESDGREHSLETFRRPY